MSKRRITVASGDGIGPEIMEATLRILKKAGAEIEIDHINIGESVYKSGHTSGIPTEAWDTIRKNKVLLKAPITTPQGGGYKSLNVTMRKTLGLFANLRPCKTFYPYVNTLHKEMDMVIIRENEEDLYAGIEHQQTDEVVQCLKLISRPGCEKIIRYAFEYAKSYNRRKVSCFSKDNIMKQTDGLFHKIFDEIGEEYPEIEKEHWIIDIGSARLADTPQDFDVIVTSNLYGDIISDIAAQISGSVGLGGSANIGQGYAMFEAIHGSAPPIAGQNIANPSGLLQGAIMMLNYIGQNKVAEKVQNAWLKTIEDGVHTADIYRDGSKQKVSTSGFADAVIERLDKKPVHLPVVDYSEFSQVELVPYKRKPPRKKELLGVDVFIDNKTKDPNDFGEQLSKIKTDNLQLKVITNRGVKVWPQGFEETFCSDHWRCRFQSDDQIEANEVLQLLGKCVDQGFDVIKTENLYRFDGKIAFSLAQGQ